MTCPACDGNRTELFHEQEGVPVHSCLLVENATSARNFPRGRLSITLCRDCGFMFNADYNAADSHYSSAYEETQGFSPHFQEFLAGLADRWVGRYGLAGSRVVEIGCGKGEFLAVLCEAGDNRGVGIDPGCIPERLRDEDRSRVRLIRDLYSEKYADLPGDVVCCRHTLEHIQPTREFMRMVRRVIGPRDDTMFFLEVPDMTRVLRERAFWDIYYEHCTYFTAGALERLFLSTGFEVLDSRKGFGDQYLLIEARPRGAEEAPAFTVTESLDALEEKVRSFAQDTREVLEGWRNRFRAWHAEGKRSVIWGAGSKGVSFLTTLGLRDEVSVAVDINPHKHGYFMAGTGHEVVAPESLVERGVDVVVVMNAIYVEEIRAQLAGRGLEPEIVPA
jgi:SAM-dependent methyltransferase